MQLFWQPPAGQLGSQRAASTQSIWQPWSRSFDGQVGTTLISGDRVEIRRADHRVLLVRLEGDSFFELMREKLHWGDLQYRQRVQ